MPHKNSFFAFLFLLLILPREENWVERKNKNDIVVFTRDVNTSAYKEIKCKTKVHASLNAIVQALCDVEHYKEWIYNCDSAYILKKVSEKEIITYQLLDVPWPVSDRDVVSRLRIYQDPVTKIVTANSDIINGFVPENDGVVRVKDFHSQYTLTPLKDGWVDISYQLGTDPGGIVPAWLVNLVIVNAPFSTQEKLNVLIQNPRYSKKEFDFISER